ncbi:hypothetical protein CWB99_19860 [Pseudoalteromonas rubra]|uniref:Uncharacterized protein n=1 Tax=Pseudoalteromonas rubra TaxID=43658 RepID=A0A5S3WGK8_9GAMM|nr:hypothetical protein [Pseudoalteromonas rubra]TMP26015.1 hypothetical protein CWB99_19860 [Pseudoalteromonas rubra]TMP28453.1 hypothetical protein CWC00_21340 [Pseudoalteromonas rubra]
MKTNAFFTWVWRINGVIILLSALFLGAILAYEVGKGVFREHDEQNVSLNLAEDKDQEENWDLGFPVQLGDYDYFLIPLESEKLIVDATDTPSVEGFKRSNSSFKVYSRYRESRMKNAILINASNNESRWLFDSVDQLIYRYGTLERQNGRLSEQNQAIFYELINEDSNADKQLDYEDELIFALSRLDGSGYTEIIQGYTEIIQGYTEIITQAVNNEGNLLLVFSRQEQVFSALIDLSTFKLLDKRFT